MVIMTSFYRQYEGPRHVTSWGQYLMAFIHQAMRKCALRGTATLSGEATVKIVLLPF